MNEKFNLQVNLMDDEAKKILTDFYEIPIRDFQLAPVYIMQEDRLVFLGSVQGAESFIKEKDGSYLPHRYPIKERHLSPLDKAKSICESILKATRGRDFFFEEELYLRGVDGEVKKLAIMVYKNFKNSNVGIINKKLVEDIFVEKIGFNPYQISSDYLSRVIYDRVCKWFNTGIDCRYDQREINELITDIASILGDVESKIDHADRQLKSVIKIIGGRENEKVLPCIEMIDHLEKVIKRTK